MILLKPFPAPRALFSTLALVLLLAAALPAFARDAGRISVENLRTHVEALASEEMAGRLTGTEGGRMATAYVAEHFEALGLEPAGDDGTFFQAFPFTAGISPGEDNVLSARFDSVAREYALDSDWRPIAFSQTGIFEATPVVFAGYGFVAPAEGDFPEYDSYVHLDVEDKWVLLLRYMPEDVPPRLRQHWARHTGLRYKAMLARDRGARGIIVVSGPTSQVGAELVRLSFDAAGGRTSIAAISITDATAAAWLSSAGEDLAELQAALDSGEPRMGFTLPELTLSAQIDLVKEQREGRNVLARLLAPDPVDAAAVVVGAHVDHLGRGRQDRSLAQDDEDTGAIHYGADDNASGVAAMLEIAAVLARQQAAGEWVPRRDVVFAAWDGEELGLLGSDAFTAQLPGGEDTPPDVSGAIAANLNLDMVGRLREKLVINGVGSSTYWPDAIEASSTDLGLSLELQEDSHLPTDSTSFYLRRVPVLSFFTGPHEEYHTPRDTPDTLHYGGIARIARLTQRIAVGLAEREEAPEFVEASRPEVVGQRAYLRAYLGTVPDYVQTGLEGVRLSGVTRGAPAQEAGLEVGDIVVRLAGRRIENIYDYTFAIEALRVGEAVEVEVLRGEELLTFTLIPGSRE